MEDNTERKVLSVLPLVEEIGILENVAAECKIQVPDAKQGNHKFLLKSIMTYLSSPDLEDLEDQGAAQFLAVWDLIKDSVHGKFKLEEHSGDENSADENLDGNLEGEEATLNVAALQKLHRLRDFKINGTIGNAGQKDKLSYSSLSYQIQNGKDRGFSEKEICSAVIRAITPGNMLRTYFESREKLSLKSMIKVLRSHFKEKDATAIFTEMSNATQLGSENELEFCMRVMGLRQKVLSLSKEEDCPYEPKLVQSQFQHALFTGLKHNNIRHELRSVLKGGKKINDEDLLQEISDVMVNETEHSDKIHSAKVKTTVNVVESENSAPKKEKKTSNLCAEISKLSLQVSELSTLKNDMEQLRSEVKGYKSELKGHKEGIGGMFGKNQSGGHRKYMCINCKSTRAPFCNHCFLCGSTEHKRICCPHRGEPTKN